MGKELPTGKIRKRRDHPRKADGRCEKKLKMLKSAKEIVRRVAVLLFCAFYFCRGDAAAEGIIFWAAPGSSLFNGAGYLPTKHDTFLDTPPRAPFSCCWRL